MNDLGELGTLAWSADGTQLAYTAIDCPGCAPADVAIDPPRAAFVLEPGGAPRLVAHEANAGIWGWSPDGTRLIFGDYGLAGSVGFLGGFELREVELQTGTIRTIEGSDVVSYDVAYSPDGWRVAYGAEAGLVVANRDFSEPMLVVPADAGFTGSGLSPRSPRWSPDGRWILFDIGWVGGDGTDAAVVRADGPLRIVNDPLRGPAASRSESGPAGPDKLSRALMASIGALSVSFSVRTSRTPCLFARRNAATLTAVPRRTPGHPRTSWVPVLSPTRPA